MVNDEIINITKGFSSVSYFPKRLGVVTSERIIFNFKASEYVRVTLFRFPLFFICTVFCLASGVAQQKKIDSLTVVLQNHLEQDTIRVRTLNELAYSYYAIDPSQGVKTADEAIYLASKIDFPDGVATAYAYKGHSLSALGKDSLALATYDIAMAMRNSMSDRKAAAKLTYNKGLVYFNQSDYQRAKDCNKQAYEVFKMEKDSFLMAKMLNSIGINDMYQSRYAKSLDSYLESKRIYELLGRTNDVQYASINANIGLLYARLEKFDFALESQRKALELFQKLDFQEGVANSLTNIGRIYTDKGSPETALLKYEEAYNIMDANNNKRGMASALTNMGIASVALGEYQKAIPYFEKTKTIYQRLKNSNNLAIVHDNLGDCFQQLRFFDKAEQNFRTAFNYAKTAGSLNLQFKALDNLAEIQTKKGDYRNAYQNKTQALILRDSFNSVEKKEEIARLEAKYEYEQEKSIMQAEFDKKQAVSLAEVARQKQTNLFITIGAIFLLAASFAGFFLYKKHKDALAEKNISDFKTKVAETELKALRSQMNPHFIFNALNSISDYMGKNDLETANTYLMKFAKLTRAILENSEKKWITLQEDLELTELYMQIEAFRLKNRLSYTINVDDALDAENTMVPPLLLQPFIENSIWHGIAEKEGRGTIDLIIKKENESVVCIVDDDGVGRKRQNKNSNEKTSMGVKITRNRLEIISILKKVKGSIAMFDKPQGLRVELKLPLELRF